MGRLLKRWCSLVLRRRFGMGWYGMLLFLDFFCLYGRQLQTVAVKLADKSPLRADRAVLLYHEHGQQSIGDEEQHYQNGEE